MRVTYNDSIDNTMLNYYINKKKINEKINKKIFQLDKLILLLEKLIILFQKFYYDYMAYWVTRFYLYNNLKILLNKNLINVHNYMNDKLNNLTFELLVDTSLYNVKGNALNNLWTSLKSRHNKYLNISNLQKNKLYKDVEYTKYNNNLNNLTIKKLDHYKNELDKNNKLNYKKLLWKNYYKWFKDAPLDLSFKLFQVSKDYSRLMTMLTYGLDYDISILKNNKTSEVLVLNDKSNSNWNIKNVDLTEKYYYDKAYKVFNYNYEAKYKNYFWNENNIMDEYVKKNFRKYNINLYWKYKSKSSRSEDYIMTAIYNKYLYDLGHIEKSNVYNNNWPDTLKEREDLYDFIDNLYTIKSLYEIYDQNCAKNFKKSLYKTYMSDKAELEKKYSKKNLAVVDDLDIKRIFEDVVYEEKTFEEYLEDYIIKHNIDAPAEAEEWGEGIEDEYLDEEEAEQWDYTLNDIIEEWEKKQNYQEELEAKKDLFDKIYEPEYIQKKKELKRGTKQRSPLWRTKITSQLFKRPKNIPKYYELLVNKYENTRDLYKLKEYKYYHYEYWQELWRKHVDPNMRLPFPVTPLCLEGVGEPLYRHPWIWLDTKAIREINWFGYTWDELRKLKFLGYELKTWRYFRYGRNGGYMKHTNEQKLFGGYSYWWNWHKDLLYPRKHQINFNDPLLAKLEFIYKRTRWTKEHFDLLYVINAINRPFKLMVGLPRKYWGEKDWTLKYRQKYLESYLRFNASYGGKILKNLSFEGYDDVKIRRRRFKYLIHGVRAQAFENKFFQTFLKGNDVWTKTNIGYANTDDPTLVGWNTLFEDQILKYKKSRRSAFGVNERIQFWNMSVSRPKLRRKKGAKYAIGMIHRETDTGISELESKIQNSMFSNYKGLYITFFKKIRKYMDISNKLYQKTTNFSTNFLQKLYIVDLWVRKDQLKYSSNISRKNNITWNEFYANIENVSQDFKLSYIQKEVYGRHDTKDFEKFVVKKSNLVSNTALPKNLNVLIKKTYVENLIDAYKIEEEPMKQYIAYKLKKELFIDELKSIMNIIYQIFYNIIVIHREGYIELCHYINLKWTKFIELHQWRHLKYFINFVNNNYKYGFILVGVSMYSLICGLLVLVIKSILPNNLIYVIRKTDKIKVLENLKKFWEKEQPYFNFEYKYIYKWNEKNLKWDKQKILNNKYKENVINNSVKTYNIFYNKFLFEENLNKWENNTKIRLNYNLWFKYIITSVGAFYKVIQFFYKDQKYNHNRKIIWKDDKLDSFSKPKYFNVIPRYFARISFIFNFVVSVFQIWEYRYFVMKWTQLVKYGIISGISYKSLEKELDKDLSIDWYKDNIDFGVGLLYTNFLEIKNKLDKIKNENMIKKKETDKIIKESSNNVDFEELLLDIIKLSAEKSKVENIIKFKELLKEKEKERIINDNFELKYENITEKLKAEIPVISEKEKIKQSLMFKYRFLVQAQKMSLLSEEIKVTKQSYTTRKREDFDDLTKKLTVLEPELLNKAYKIKQEKTEKIIGERLLREKNFKNNIIDKALDHKEKSMFETIKEYNQELNNAWAEVDKSERLRMQEKSNYEQTSKLLFNNLEENYIAYRFYTTMWSRFYYIISMIISFFTIWIEHLSKIRKNDYSVTSLFLIIKNDLLKYIYKIYWEYIFVWKKYETFKKLGNQFKEILKFSLLILTPITILGIILYISLGLYYICKTLLEKNLKNKLKKINNIILKKRIIRNFLIFLNKFTILKVLFADMKTGEGILLSLYIKFYKLCAFIQRNIYYIKGAFILGYKEGNIYLGIKNIFKYINLKYKVYIEKQKKKEKKNWKTYFFEKKYDLKRKKNLILILWDLEKNIETVHIKFIKGLYRYIIYPLFKTDYITFYKIYNNNIIWLKNNYNKLFDNIIVLKLLINKLTVVELFKLLSNFIWEIILLPLKFFKRYYNLLFLENYKEGIVINFWSFLKVKRKNKKISKIHKILMSKKISNYLKIEKETESSGLEMYISFKCKDIRPDKHKDHYVFWKEIYLSFIYYKKKFYNYFIDIMEELEETYASFEVAKETRTWSYYKRIKYGYYAKKLKIQLENKQYKLEEKRLSRNKFFDKKSKERDKLIRKYFFKGILNWISYILTGKVIFKEIKELKSQKMKVKKKNYKHIKYKLNNLSEKYHISKYLDDVPPQLWALVIIFEIYYKNFFRYVFGPGEHEDPTPWHPNLKYSRDRKWRISSIVDRRRIDYTTTPRIEQQLSYLDLRLLANNMKKTPYDPLIRWFFFILENEIMKEIVGKHNVWGDISLTHLLTYNSRLDAYTYEIKEFFRILEGTTLFRWKENKLEEDKMQDYKVKYDRLLENILIRNENIIQEVLKERRENSIRLLYKVFLYYAGMATEDKEWLKEEEKTQDLFYSMKVSLFEEYDIVEFLEWKGNYNVQSVEYKYFNRKDIDSVKFWQTNEFAKFNVENIPMSMEHLANNIVLLSFDETWTDIIHFLKSDILNQIEKENNIIHYKNLNIINPSIIKNIYWDSYIKVEKRSEYGTHLYGSWEDKDKDNELLNFISLDFDIMKWKEIKYDLFYGLNLSNIIYTWNEIGKYYPYDDQDPYDPTLIKVEIYDSYHGNYFLSKWISRLSKRLLNLKNVTRKSWKQHKNKQNQLNRNKKDYGAIAYVNNVRWSWEQWIGYSNVENEDNLLKRNILIFQDRCNIWFLKRAPLRLPVPVKLDINLKKIKGVLKLYNEERGIIDLDTNHFFFARQIKTMISDSLQFLQWKRAIEEKYKKPLNELIISIAAEVKDPTFKDLDIDKQIIMGDFIDKFTVYNKLYHTGLQAYTWDMLRYQDMFVIMEMDDPSGYFDLKQKEYLLHDVSLKKYSLRFLDMALSKYSPTRYGTVYNSKTAKALYWAHNIAKKMCWLMFFEILFYHPGEYLANPSLLYAPILTYAILLYLNKYIKKMKEIKSGKDLYLYKYQDYDDPTYIESIMSKESDLEKQAEEYNFLHNTDFEADAFVKENEEEWSEAEKLEYLTRRKQNLREEDNFYYNSYMLGKLAMLAFILAQYAFIEQWYQQYWKFRNVWWLWDYYREEEEDMLAFMPEYEFFEKGYNTRTWPYDCYYRLEEGGNYYSRWYENVYRSYAGKEPLPLDPGYFDSQIIKDVDLYMWLEEGISGVHLQGSVVEAYWNHLARRSYKDIPEYIDISKYDYMLLTPDDVQEKVQKRKQTIGEVLNNKIKYENETINFQADIIEIMGIKFRNLIRDILRYLFLDEDQGKLYNPLLRWMKFKKEMWDEYNYNILENLVIFTCKAKAKTKSLILRDINRYYEYKELPEVREILKRSNINKLKKYSFETGKPLDIVCHLGMSDQEKHWNILCNNFLNYKLKRLHYEKDYCLPSVLNELNDKRWVEMRSRDVKSEITELNMMIYRQENYLDNIFKKISYEDKIEYKANLWIDFWTKDKWTLEYLQEFIYTYPLSNSTSMWNSISEYIDIILKVINSL